MDDTGGGEMEEMEEIEDIREEMEFDFDKAFENMYIPQVGNGRKTSRNYEEYVKCLESLSYEVVTTKEEYLNSKGKTVFLAWCPLRHKICKVLLAIFVCNHNTFCSECKKIRTEKTSLIRYGSKCSLGNKEVREKGKETMMKIYGVKHATQSKEIREKKDETCLDRYGHKCALQNKEVQMKRKETCQEKYGTPHPLLNTEVRKKADETNIKRFGFANVMQNREMFKKQQEIAFTFKDYTLPSGRVIKYQGYEHFCYEELLFKEHICEEDIVTLYNNLENYPFILYEYEGTERVYYPDIYIESQNKIIEVKSTYTYEKDLEVNQAKARACKEMGYNFEFRIYKKNGDIKEVIIL